MNILTEKVLWKRFFIRDSLSFILSLINCWDFRRLRKFIKGIFDNCEVKFTDYCEESDAYTTSDEVK